MKNCYRNCHFLGRKIWLNNLTPRYEQIPLKWRSEINNNSGLCCFYGEWNSDDPIYEPIKNLPQHVDRPGRDCFWSYKEGMSFEAGMIRQEKESEIRRLQKNHRLTQIGLLISATGLLGSFMYSIVKDFFL